LYPFKGKTKGFALGNNVLQEMCYNVNTNVWSRSCTHSPIKLHSSL